MSVATRERMLYFMAPSGKVIAYRDLEFLQGTPLFLSDDAVTFRQLTQCRWKRDGQYWKVSFYDPERQVHGTFQRKDGGPIQLHGGEYYGLLDPSHCAVLLEHLSRLRLPLHLYAMNRYKRRTFIYVEQLRYPWASTMDSNNERGYRVFMIDGEEIREIRVNKVTMYNMTDNPTVLIETAEAKLYCPSFVRARFFHRRPRWGKQRLTERDLEYCLIEETPDGIAWPRRQRG